MHPRFSVPKRNWIGPYFWSSLLVISSTIAAAAPPTKPAAYPTQPPLATSVDTGSSGSRPASDLTGTAASAVPSHAAVLDVYTRQVCAGEHPQSGPAER